MILLFEKGKKLIMKKKKKKEKRNQQNAEKQNELIKFLICFEFQE